MLIGVTAASLVWALHWYNKKNHNTTMQDKYGWTFDFEKAQQHYNTQRDNKEEYFKQWYQPETLTIKNNANQTINIIKDCDLYLYIPNDKDFDAWTKQLRSKIASYPQFDYLNDQSYDNKIRSFNITNEQLKQLKHSKNAVIPIPLPHEMRKIPRPQYIEYGTQAIEHLRNNKIYQQDLTTILETISEAELIEFFTAIAKKESTWPNHSDIGYYEYFRFENGNMLSVWSWHVLLKWPGKKAKQQLGLTIGQLYHPVNSIQHMIAFMIEKVNEQSLDKEWNIVAHVKKRKLTNISMFIKNKRYDKFAKFYNGKDYAKNNYNKDIKNTFLEIHNQLHQ